MVSLFCTLYPLMAVPAISGGAPWLTSKQWMVSDPLLSVQLVELARHNGFAKPIILCIVSSGWEPFFTLRVAEATAWPLRGGACVIGCLVRIVAVVGSGLFPVLSLVLLTCFLLCTSGFCRAFRLLSACLVRSSKTGHERFFVPLEPREKKNFAM